MPETNNNEKTVTDTGSAELKMFTPQGVVHHAHVAPILTVLIIMLVFILGGLFLWGSMLSKNAQVPNELPVVNNEPETPRAVADQQILETVSSSDELSAIEADISSTNFDSIDTDLAAIEIEFNTAEGQ